MPEQSRQSLAIWRFKVGESEAERICQESKERGITIHKLIEGAFKRKEMSEFFSHWAYWQHLKPVVDKIQHPRQIEQPITHHELQYQGRFDMLASWNKKLSIIDFKSSEKPKKKEWLSDAFLQIAAYKGALDKYSDWKIEQGVIIVATPIETQVFVLDRVELEQWWQEWLNRLLLYTEAT